MERDIPSPSGLLDILFKYACVGHVDAGAGPRISGTLGTLATAIHE